MPEPAAAKPGPPWFLGHAVSNCGAEPCSDDGSCTWHLTKERVANTEKIRALEASLAASEQHVKALQASYEQAFEDAGKEQAARLKLEARVRQLQEGWKEDEREWIHRVRAALRGKP